jgi:hypothetical protein
VAKVLCVLYEDRVEGYPGSYARDAIPRIERYYDGQTTPTPAGWVPPCSGGVVDRGALAGAGAHSYSAGDATGGSDEAARFKDR